MPWETSQPGLRADRRQPDDKALASLDARALHRPPRARPVPGQGSTKAKARPQPTPAGTRHPAHLNQVANERLQTWPGVHVG